jgi:hypothetical protein
MNRHYVRQCLQVGVGKTAHDAAKAAEAREITSDWCRVSERFLEVTSYRQQSFGGVLGHVETVA